MKYKNEALFKTPQPVAPLDPKKMAWDYTIGGDFPIPFVAAWTLEESDIQYSEAVAMPAVFTGEVDHRFSVKLGLLGKPQLGQMAPQRQRFVMQHDLCQVCGRPNLTRIELGHPAHHGPERLLAYDEPPCCATCALKAIVYCPYAKRGWDERGSLLIGARRLYTQVARIEAKDDRTKFNKIGPPLPRATFRRYLNTPLAVHLRLVPITAAPIQGQKGLDQLRHLADGEARLRCE